MKSIPQTAKRKLRNAPSKSPYRKRKLRNAPPLWTFKELVKTDTARIGGETSGKPLDIEKVNALRGRVFPAETAKIDIYIHIYIYIYTHTYISIYRKLRTPPPQRVKGKLRDAPRQSPVRSKKLRNGLPNECPRNGFRDKET